MNITRNFLLEQSFCERILAIQQEASPWTTMGSDYLRKTSSELSKTASVHQDVYDFALNCVGQELDFFEKEASLNNALLSLVKAAPPEIQDQFIFLLDAKSAAYRLICSKLDAQFDPIWSPISLEDLPSLLVRVETMLQEISLMGANSPLVNELVTYLSTVTGL